MGSGRGSSRRARSARSEELIKLKGERLAAFTLVRDEEGEEGEIVSSSLEPDGCINYTVKYYDPRLEKQRSNVPQEDLHLVSKRIENDGDATAYEARNLLGNIVYLNPFKLLREERQVSDDDSRRAEECVPAQVICILPTQRAMREKAPIVDSDLRLVLRFYTEGKGRVGGYRLDDVTFEPVTAPQLRVDAVSF